MGSSTPQAPKGTAKPKEPKRMPKRTQRAPFEMVRGKPTKFSFGGTIADARRARQAPKGPMDPKGPKRMPKRTQRALFEMVRGRPSKCILAGERSTTNELS